MTFTFMEIIICLQQKISAMKTASLQYQAAIFYDIVFLY